MAEYREQECHGQRLCDQPPDIFTIGKGVAELAFRDHSFYPQQELGRNRFIQVILLADQKGSTVSIFLRSTARQQEPLVTAGIVAGRQFDHDE